ncbi:C45 family autoproteolytic acyltransferase/hydolase [Azotosporobacter soli]|uniref:C45 family autoproteolytic acyltransferase/hydolase n=1 Tax=Azotosporobacter soli TaxID=3055040 RepID=UPI0031FEBC7D
MRKQIVLLLTGLCLSLAPTAQACTLWSAAGSSAAGGGTLLVKNRDWLPNHRQEVKLVRPKGGHAYWGLFAVGGNEPGLKAGLNDQGLSIVTATASVVTRETRQQEPHTPGLTSRLLRECSSVAEVLQHEEWLRGVEYLLLADRQETAVIELAPGGRYAVQRARNGVLTHTNHYLDESFLELNQQIGESSRTRYERIGQLLAENRTPYQVSDFLRISRDQNAGPDNSLLRSGSTLKKARTMAIWAVRIPPQGTPDLVVTLFNPGEEETTLRLSGAELFGN